jgi:hypothetical protein
MGSDEKPVVAKPPPSSNPWAQAAMWVGIALVVAGSLALSLRSCLRMPERALRNAGETIDKASQAMASIAAAFRQGTVTTSFVSYATTVTNTHYFQFATLKQMEIFTRSEEPSTAFGYVPLPDVVVEARAPVEYTYYLDLNGKWRFELRDGMIQVFAPPIRANRPSVDVSALTYEVKRGHFKVTEAVDNLKRSVSSLVILRAKENIPLVRETGRRQTEEFVQKWLARSFTDGKDYPVKVYFPGETPPDRLPPIPQVAH